MFWNMLTIWDNAGHVWTILIRSDNGEISAGIALVVRIGLTQHQGGFNLVEA